MADTWAKGQLVCAPSNNEIRRIMLQYFYDRNKNATSARGKKGSAVKISDVKKGTQSDQPVSRNKNAEQPLLTLSAKAGSKKIRWRNRLPRRAEQ